MMECYKKIDKSDPLEDKFCDKWYQTPQDIDLRYKCYEVIGAPKTKDR